MQRFFPAFLFDVSVLWICELPLAEAPVAVDPGFVFRPPSEIERLVESGRLREKLGPAATDPTAVVWTLDVDGEPAGYFLLRKDCYRPFHFLRLDVEPFERAGAELYVAPERRGRGLGPRMNELAAHHYRLQGFTRIVSIVDVRNRNALRGDEKVGYRRLDRLVVVRFLGLMVIRVRHRTHVGRWTDERPFLLSTSDL
jgi:GNAT superfamily N-acetyltransferase